jgi:uncharacterized protein YacL
MRLAATQGETMSLQATLAICITLMVAAIGVMFVFHPPDATNQILTSLISTVMTVFVMVFSFYFGSSSGSKDKDDTVKQIALGTTVPAEDKPAAPAATVAAAPTKLASVSPAQQSGA